MAIDIVNRGKAMVWKGVSRALRTRMHEIYEETKSKSESDEKTSEKL